MSTFNDSSEECSGSNSNVLVRRSFEPFRRHESSLVRLANEEDDEVQFDTSDSEDNVEVMMAGKRYTSIQEFASAIPNHLLLGSLLEHLCFLYESNPTRSHTLFKVIGQRLVAMNLLSPFAVSDEFSTVRLQHNRAFTELLSAASSSLYPPGQQCVGSDPHSVAVRSKEGLFQAPTSRYLSEFEEICRLGKGSYGNVFKVLNKLDGQCYAMKKILIKKVSKDDCMKVLREVKMLSGLNHVNVVGYHTAWLEHVQPAAHSAPVLPALESPGQQDQTEGSTDSSRSSTGSSILFQNHSQTQPLEAPGAETHPEDMESVTALVPAQEKIPTLCPKTRALMPEDYVPCVFLGQRGPLRNSKCPPMKWDSSVLMEEESRWSNVEPNSNSLIDTEIQQLQDKHKEKASKEAHFHLMLYIQMQLCERSLKDWILERNTKPREEQQSRCPYGCVDAERTLSLLRMILEGVEYIHSRGIMHRDLKPRNIFLHGDDCHIRIGDFGLACRDLIVDDHKGAASASCGFSHTTGVGTFVYAAPEQLNGSSYDSKSDMYSIGILAFELFQPFGTEMERVLTLGDLREMKIPDSFCQRWPLVAEHITKLTHKEPSVRPTATQLLQSQLFSNKDLVINSLQRRVEEQEKEILQLRRQISQLHTSQTSPS